MLFCTGLSVYKTLVYSLEHIDENCSALFPSSTSGKHWLLAKKQKGTQHLCARCALVRQGNLPAERSSYLLLYRAWMELNYTMLLV